MNYDNPPDLDRLLVSFDRALLREPDLVDAHAGRGMALRRLGRRAEALISLERAIALQPDRFDAVETRAIVLGEMRRGEEALAAFDASIALRPDEAASHANRARVLRQMNRLDEAYAAFDRATALKGDLAAAWYGKGMIRLLQGRYREGWPLHEWRWRLPGFAEKPRGYVQPMWDGTPFPSRTLFVHAEQGFGDAIQFLRFVPLAARLGGRVVLEAPARLAPLLAEQADAPAIIPRGQETPPFDLWCPLMSLPWLLGIDLPALPPPFPLRADPGRVRDWAARLPPRDGKPRIGIAWAGSPQYPNDRDRSMPARVMLDMIDRDATVVSLQLTDSDADRAVLRADPRVVDPGDALIGFAETAAAIETLDLVVTVDTAIGHLAACMGRPAWVLLAAVPDWRWMLDRSNSPWYPSVRLFRQTALGDWTGVARQVRKAQEEVSVPS